MTSLTTKNFVKLYSDELAGGWWYGTNNSAAETNAWLQRASSCAGLIWGNQLRTSLDKAESHG
jgi:hypothetical protein